MHSPTLHYTGLHHYWTTLHWTTLDYITLHYVTLDYIKLDHKIQNYITLLYLLDRLLITMHATIAVKPPSFHQFSDEMAFEGKWLQCYIQSSAV